MQIDYPGGTEIEGECTHNFGLVSMAGIRTQRHTVIAALRSLRHENALSSKPA